MWRVFRPDAMEALRDDKARRSLARYFDVMEGKLPARFLVCKRVAVKTDLSVSDEKLWRAHELGLKDFQKVLADIDEGKTKLDNLKRPKSSLLDLKVELARRILKSCHFCERGCGDNRRAGEVGTCGVIEQSRISSEFMHHGEESVLVPSYTIFFAGCTFHCQFCQNYDISQYPDSGVKVSPQTLAKLVEGARKEGARNVNWVGGDPTPNIHNILAALNECKISVPSVFNSNMYCSLEAMKLLFATQDVYLTDFKYGNNRCALRYSKVPKYLETVGRNHRLAFADSELIIRHLVMPDHVECCTKPILNWIVDNLGKMVRTNLMNQYRPCYMADKYPEINRNITSEEFKRALEIAKKAGLQNLEP